MTVGLEFVSVIVKRSSVDLKYPGGSSAYLKEFEDCLGIFMSYDEYLIRESAMSNIDLKKIVISWQSHGLIARKRVTGKMAWIDLCIVHALCGPTKPCNWLTYDYDTQSVSFSFEQSS